MASLSQLIYLAVVSRAARAVFTKIPKQAMQMQ